MADKIPEVNNQMLIDSGLNAFTINYLQDMGAMCATYGAVGLFHAENITPESVDLGKKLLKPDFQRYVIDEQELESLLQIDT